MDHATSLLKGRIGYPEPHEQSDQLHDGDQDGVKECEANGTIDLDIEEVKADHKHDGEDLALEEMC